MGTRKENRGIENVCAREDQVVVVRSEVCCWVFDLLIGCVAFRITCLGVRTNEKMVVGRVLCSVV